MAWKTTKNRLRTDERARPLKAHLEYLLNIGCPREIGEIWTRWFYSAITIKKSEQYPHGCLLRDFIVHLI